jgi:hypothetical protein
LPIVERRLSAQLNAQSANRSEISNGSRHPLVCSLLQCERVTRRVIFQSLRRLNLRIVPSDQSISGFYDLPPGAGRPPPALRLSGRRFCSQAELP